MYLVYAKIYEHVMVSQQSIYFLVHCSLYIFVCE